MQRLTERVEVSLAGVWHNQHGTEIDLIVLGDGRISGILTIRPNGNNDQVEQYPLTGFYNKGAVTFCTDFGDHDSMCAWVGQFGEQDSCFETMWHLVANAHRDANKGWRTTLTGTDVFNRGKCSSTLEPSSRAGSHPRYCGII